MIAKLYRKDHKKLVRYFFNNRKKIQSFKWGWLAARGKKTRTPVPVIQELFGVGPLSS